MTDKERDQFIAEKLNAGIKLAEIQTLLEKNFNVRLTYMELRLIAADLEVNWAKQQPVKTEEEKIVKVAPEKTPCETAQVVISKIAKPGTMVNGEVTFKSGNRAEWWIDSQGRPGLNPLDGYDRPTQEDVQDFSIQLQNILSQQSY